MKATKETTIIVGKDCEKRLEYDDTVKVHNYGKTERLREIDKGGVGSMTQGERAEERKVGGTSKAETAQEEREK